MTDLDSPIPYELVDDEVSEPLNDLPTVDMPAVDGCEVCGKDVGYSGRGRKPKRCTDCRKQTTTPKTSTAKAKGSWQAPLAQALQGQFASIGMVVYTFDQFDGQVILHGSGGLATSLVKVAEQNPKVRSGLESMVTAGAWAAVVTAIASMAIPILAHHNVIPAIAMPGMQNVPTGTVG